VSIKRVADCSHEGRTQKVIIYQIRDGKSGMVNPKPLSEKRKPRLLSGVFYYTVYREY
jgi:hypothetical protein